MTTGSSMMRSLASALLVLVALASIPASVHGQANPGSSTVKITMNADERLRQFAGLLDRAGINSAQALTMLAPTSDAFEKFRASNPARFTKWMEEPEFFVHLKQLLEWHLVTEGIYSRSDIFDGSRAAMENLQGNITINQQTQMIDNVAASEFVDSNVVVAEGYMHVLDNVIVPPFLGEDLIKQLLNDRSYKFALSNMANLALHVGLEDRINAEYDKGLTFLVPPNRRFNRAEIDVPKLLSEEMFNYTRDFILCHMIVDMYHEAQIFAEDDASNEDQRLVISELGTHMWITTTEEKLRFQSIEVLVPDLPSENGIFHIMDFPLFPPMITDFAFFTPISTSHDTSDCFRLFRQCILSSEDIAGLYNTSLTVMCPTREAFAFFNNEDFQRLLEPIWYRHACEFLFNHITTPAMTRQELAAQAPGVITMLNGAKYQLRKSGEDPRIKNGEEQGRSEFGDLIALDGYLHTMDTAITPTAVSRSIYDQSNENPEFSLLVENIDFVDLTDLVDRDLPLTMLAPDNRAWRRIEFGTLEGGEIIKRHIFRGLFFCDVLANLTSVSAVNGIVHGVELRGEFNESLWVGGAHVYECDILARNGVLHHVDRVIGEDYETVPPTISPAPTITASPTSSEPPSAAPTELFQQGPDGNHVEINLPPVRPPTQNDLVSADGPPVTGGDGSSSDATSTRIFLLAPTLVWMASFLLL